MTIPSVSASCPSARGKLIRDEPPEDAMRHHHSRRSLRHQRNQPRRGLCRADLLRLRRIRAPEDPIRPRRVDDRSPHSEPESCRPGGDGKGRLAKQARDMKLTPSRQPLRRFDRSPKITRDDVRGLPSQLDQGPGRPCIRENARRIVRRAPREHPITIDHATAMHMRRRTMSDEHDASRHAADNSVLLRGLQ